jgi:tetratricopeptide (TPR) repeat protein
MLGKRSEALQHMYKALQLRPNDAETLYFAGLVHAVLGEKDQAIFWLQAAMKRGYSRAEIESAVELDELRSSPQFESRLSGAQ